MNCRAKQNISDENILERHVGKKAENPVKTQPEMSSDIQTMK